eukprot:SAG31_NODE_584_length_13886_cov_96.615000_2_plen_260_part_00
MCTYNDRPTCSHQVTFATEPTEYAFIEWCEAHARADSTERSEHDDSAKAEALVFTPAELEEKEAAETDATVAAMKAELVPAVVPSEELFWARYLYRVHSFQMAEKKRAELIALISDELEEGEDDLGWGDADGDGLLDSTDADGWGDLSLDEPPSATTADAGSSVADTAESAPAHPSEADPVSHSSGGGGGDQNDADEALDWGSELSDEAEGETNEVKSGPINDDADAAASAETIAATPSTEKTAEPAEEEEDDDWGTWE